MIKRVSISVLKITHNVAITAIAPKKGPDKPQPSICIPIASPNSVFEIPKSLLKSIKNIPKTCLTLNDMNTTSDAPMSVNKAVLLFINFSELI